MRECRDGIGLHSYEIIKFEAKKASYANREAPEVQRFKQVLLSVMDESEEEITVYASLEGARLSAGCIDETIGAALKEVVKERVLKRDPITKHLLALDEEYINEWDADAALKKASKDFGHKLVCVWRGSPEAVSLVGDVDEQVESTYNFVLNCENGEEATTRKLANHYDLSIQAASNRMSRAAQLGIIRKEKGETVRGGGRQNVYKPVK